MNKYLKHFLFIILIIGATALLTTVFSIIGTNFLKNSKNVYQYEDTIDYVIEKSCGCTTIEKSTSYNRTTSNKPLFKHIYVLKGCNSIDIKKVSKKILTELLKKGGCSDLNIEVLLCNKQNNFTSFKINNCNITLDE
ncbi:MAG: hypothetical protein HRT69_13990 [Flavobacteriaceae bacterium]|nr:hypothetical protein [Flavobacteriaceae bacterium]